MGVNVLLRNDDMSGIGSGKMVMNDMNDMNDIALGRFRRLKAGIRPCVQSRVHGLDR